MSATESILKNAIVPFARVRHVCMQDFELQTADSLSITLNINETFLRKVSKLVNSAVYRAHWSNVFKCPVLVQDGQGSIVDCLKFSYTRTVISRSWYTTSSLLSPSDGIVEVSEFGDRTGDGDLESMIPVTFARIRSPFRNCSSQRPPAMLLQDSKKIS